eukprot:CAMPEP_0196657226 /NCGR_PEP_ID=MMETSP1086-20130531/22520_1 /TAXON_ID=77921 /ORGANISM="Cyanoptyche  gloeocystis , Strain SAG4.97" /LENGTH=67 /DNA_ID=CAMNT_0041990277 /DNA_START=200 /DNA_END=403 /DNA_ORIENTATION=+
MVASDADLAFPRCGQSARHAISNVVAPATGDVVRALDRVLDTVAVVITDILWEDPRVTRAGPVVSAT